MLDYEKKLKERAEAIKQDLIDWRRYLHQFPELSFQEEKTSAFVAACLEKLQGIEIQRGIAGHGIVAVLKNDDGPVIALRADMDALPIQETTGLSFASTHDGVMHACGHDAHTATLLGAAQLLAEDFQAGSLPRGTIKFLFQPAEEDTDVHGLTGAPYFLEAGVLDDVEAALALHMCPWRQTGDLQVNTGPSMASIDNFELTIKGEGGHAGYPHQTIDPVWIAAHTLQGLYGLVSRKIDPLGVAALSVGSIHGGAAFNVIPDQVTIKGTVRAYTDKVRRQLIEELEAVAASARLFGGSHQLHIEKGEPALCNDGKLVELWKDTARTLFPDQKIHEAPYGMGGEDFSHIARKLPSAMAFLGCGWKDKENPPLHSPCFTLNEEVLPYGVALFTAAAHRLLQRQER
ncbi:M20 metallopeptidase family protein [Sediminibacillus halophilus]|uniref:Amidohydrolase n=1 Tax=Sediminibacillus halophilus TaxID=482461 RepID=A0A1G9TFQ6_9BACI|nr:amidohydrolase [Sediminibacillus halophilus]SDM46418.1 amidohydrolase [Sediminibacillus halophilus]